MSTRQSFYILNVRIDELTLKETLKYIDKFIVQNKREYVVLTGAHGIIEMQKNEKLLKINNLAGLVTPDGMPEVWLGRMKGYSNIEKVYAPDIMKTVFNVSAKRGYRHFLYGGKPGVAEKLKKILEREYPGISIVGIFCPPFRALSEDDVEKISALINLSKADIVWCGLGCPKQEYWMAKFRPKLNASVLIGVGAGFDFLSGEKKLAPNIIKKSGFEWLYRIFNEPVRLIKRYGRVVPLFIFYNILNILGMYKKKSQ